MLKLEPEMDARARSGCSSQKWMLVPGVDARARTRNEKSAKRRRLPRNGLVQTPVFSGRPIFRVKAAET